MRRNTIACIGCLLGLSLVLAARGDDAIQSRGGLANSFRILAESRQAGQPAAWSTWAARITQGQGASREALCYRALLSGQIRRLAPKCPLVEADHSLAGAGSWLAAFRASTDVVQHYLPLTLVVLELAGADTAESPERGRRALEGLVRQIRQAHPQADLLFVYTGARQSPAIAWHEEIARHYNIASVNLTGLAAGGQTTDKVHALYAQAIRPLLEKSQVEADGSKPVKHPLPKPLCAAPMERARMLTLESSRGRGWPWDQRAACRSRPGTQAQG